MHKLGYIILLISIGLFSSFSIIDETIPPNDKFVIVLDAGHGGHDPGNLGNKYIEKDIALNVVLKIGKQLEKNPNIKVVYTRKTDVFIELDKRGEIANKAKADLFVSIHCNSFHTQANGTETFVLGLHRNKTNLEVAKKENSVILLEEDYHEKYAGYDPNSPESIIGLTLMQEEYLDQSIQLADYIQKSFKNKLKRKSRGVKQAGFIVLHQTVMPSVLIELGFLTYKKEGAYLNSKKGQDEMSNSIVESILEYKKSIDQGSVDDIYIKESVSNTNTYKDIIFKVQLAASSKNLKLKSYNFKGMSDLSKVKQGKLYRYYSGSTNDYAKIKDIQKVAKTKGYPDCYIVAYKNGTKVSLSTVLKK